MQPLVALYGNTEKEILSLIECHHGYSLGSISICYLVISKVQEV